MSVACEGGKLACERFEVAGVIQWSVQFDVGADGYSIQAGVVIMWDDLR